MVKFYMSASAIVKHLNLFKCQRSGLSSRFKCVVMPALILQCAKETLHRCIMRALRFAQMPASS